MAILQATLFSNALTRTVPATVILPSDKYDGQGRSISRPPYKTLYLLHGYLGSTLDWITGTRICRWATERDLAVVMPSGDNSVYIDHASSGENYGQFISRELVELTRAMFPLSDKREDTFIGGLSMGGLGALRNGLACPETFGSIITLSGALDFLEQQPPEELSMFGPPEEVLNGDKNPAVLLRRFAEDPSLPKPKIFSACGTEDPLLPGNRLYRTRLEDAGFDLTYVEAPGNHNWDFWDTYILEALKWLPLSDGSQGLTSGNIDGK